MYEVTLGTGGIQQIGWAPARSSPYGGSSLSFSNQEGVGDLVNT